MADDRFLLVLKEVGVLIEQAAVNLVHLCNKFEDARPFFKLKARARVQQEAPLWEEDLKTEQPVRALLLIIEHVV